MSARAKIRTAIFGVLLGVAQMVGAPIDPHEIEEVQHVMNQPKVEVVIEKSDANKPLPFDSR